MLCGLLGDFYNVRFKLILKLSGGKNMKWFDYIVFALLALVYLISPYDYGLFFEQFVYQWEIATSALFIIYFAVLFFTKQEDIKLISFISFVFPLVYVLTIFVAETPLGNLNQLMRMTMYASTFSMLMTLTKRQPFLKKVIPYVVFAAAAWITIFAYLVFIGKYEFTDSMLGIRMSGIFQYPNTFATVLSAFYLFALMLIVRLKTPGIRFIYFSLPLVPFIYGIFASGSRGVFALIPVVWLFGFILLKSHEQVRFGLYSLITAFTGFYLYNLQSSSEPEVFYTREYVTYTVISVVVMVVIHYVFNFLAKQKFMRFVKWHRLILPVIMIGVVGYVAQDLLNEGPLFMRLPTYLQTRLSTLDLETQSATARFEFFDVALEMFKQSPLLGYGGFGWGVAFTNYQIVPFWSKETHSFIFNWLVEFGLIGAVLFIGVFTIFVVYAVKSHRKGHVYSLASLIALTMLFAHAVIDFDFSYGTVMLMVFWLVATAIDADVLTAFKLKKWSISPRVLLAFKVLVMAFVLIVGIYQTRSYLAVEARQSVSQTNSVVELEDKFVTAISHQPYNTDYRLELVELYVNMVQNDPSDRIREKAIEHLERIAELEPNHAQVIYRVGNYYAQLGMTETAIEYYAQALEADYYESNLYGAYLFHSVEYAINLLNEDQATEAKPYLEQSDDYYSFFFPVTEEHPTRGNRSNRLDKVSHFRAGQAAILLGDYEEGLVRLERVAIDPEQDQELIIQMDALKVVVAERLGNKAESEQITAKYVDDAHFNQTLENYQRFIEQLNK